MKPQKRINRLSVTLTNRKYCILNDDKYKASKTTQKGMIEK